MSSSDTIALAAVVVSGISVLFGWRLQRRNEALQGQIARRDDERQVDLHNRNVALTAELHNRTVTQNGAIHQREIEVSERQHLEDLWQGVLSLAGENPRFLDVNVTENYLSAMDQQERFLYDIYCHRAWGHVADVVNGDFADKEKFQVAIQWLVTFHHQWLSDNPGMFPNEKFWQAVDRGKSMPAIILRHPRLPKRPDGEIDWDAASVDYHSRVLSPLNPAMLEKDENGVERNLLIGALRADVAAAGSTAVEIADFGCGNGNLLDALEGLPVKVVGIDQAGDALRIAKRRAIEKMIPFTTIEADLTEMRLVRTFDRIVSVNSILPSRPEDVGAILTTIRAHLHPERGVLYAILPSFDTTEHLQQLWYDQFLETSGEEEHARRVVNALRMRKKVNTELRLYADDGESQQCYHTRESILEDFAAAGLQIQGSPVKIHYPWELTRRFDYGYFPKATGDAEIWDWFVIAKPGPIPAPPAEAVRGEDGTDSADWLPGFLPQMHRLTGQPDPDTPVRRPADNPARQDVDD